MVWSNKQNMQVTDVRTFWQEYPKGNGHTVVGTVLVSQPLYGPAKNMERRLYVYLPPSYFESTRRYPVLYMQDGQNLFDDPLSYSGEWHVDETMEALSQEGIEGIIVGVANSGSMRSIDYSAQKRRQWGGGGGGDAYLDFLAQTIKPIVDESFRTIPDREHTGLMGSSLGGLISLYGLLKRPDVFGFAGVVSSAFWWSEGSLLPFVEKTPFVGGRIYMDVGDSETADVMGRREAYLNDSVRMDALLRRKGYKPEDLLFVIDKGGIHHETAWGRRLPDALRFLLGPISPGRN